jgi:hypothetical protein
MLERIRSNVGKGAFLLDHRDVYACDSVVEEKVPPRRELRLIIEAAGGSWIKSLASLSAMSKSRGSHILITTSDPEIEHSETERE